MPVAGSGLLIFRPEPRSDRFFDVGESLLFVLPLRHTSGQGRAFDNKPAIFRLLKLHMEDHDDILPAMHRWKETKGKATRVSALGCLCLSLCLPLSGPAEQTVDAVRLYDNSDWWSGSRKSVSDDSIKVQERELATPNFQVLGINLGETMISQAAAKLGKATVIERGDASTGRRQVCYASRGSQGKVYLIFEKDEVGYAFYLFAGGPVWEGADRCIASKAIARSLATASGLHLGQTTAQVIAILGKPTKQRDYELVYSFSVKKKTSPEDLKEARERNPEMSDKDFRYNYGYYNLGTGIDARFVGSKLTYLAVSKVESN